MNISSSTLNTTKNCSEYNLGHLLLNDYDDLKNNTVLVNLYERHNQQYSCSDYNDKTKQSNNFVILHLNARSLLKNFTKLEIFISTLRRKPDVITVSETWLKHTQEKLCTLMGYHFVSRPRIKRRGGGVGMYIADMHAYSLPKLTTSLDKSPTDNYESLLVRVTAKSGNVYNVLSIYRPPSANITHF